MRTSILPEECLDPPLNQSSKPDENKSETEGLAGGQTLTRTIVPGLPKASQKTKGMIFRAQKLEVSVKYEAMGPSTQIAAVN